MKELSETRLLSLLRKYRVLSDLRRGVLPPSVQTLRPLSSEFPGALRELDCLSLPLLDRRGEAVADAGRGSTAEPWIGWMLAYHEQMRRALQAKARLRGAGPSATALIARVATELTLELGAPCEHSFVARVAGPPEGRLNSLVFELLERELGEPRAALERALFPRATRV